MYAVEFEAPIENGVVHIPQRYQDLQKNIKAKFVVMYSDSANNTIKKDDEVKSQLEEFRKLRSKSNNKIMATMDLVINTDAEMLDDDLF